MVAEEVPGVGLGQQLHGLGVDLRQVRTQARIVRHRLAADGEIPLEPVAQLVGVYGDVTGGAVAVGKDEGHPVGGTQHVAEAHAGNFIGRAGHVQQVVYIRRAARGSSSAATGTALPSGNTRARS